MYLIEFSKQDDKDKKSQPYERMDGNMISYFR